VPDSTVKGTSLSGSGCSPPQPCPRPGARGRWLRRRLHTGRGFTAWEDPSSAGQHCSEM